MTRRFRQVINCPACSCEMTIETPFSIWIRTNPRLESADGTVINDADYLHHVFKDDHGRDVQYIMLIEIKTFGAAPTDQQRDTLNIFGQFLRNRHTTPTKSKNFRQVEDVCNEAWSTMNRRKVRVRAFGSHLLQFEKTSPSDSAWIKWDGVGIDIDTLEGILRFEIDPDTKSTLDNRSHHQQEMALLGGNGKRLKRA
jgi:hypothetical protein